MAVKFVCSTGGLSRNLSPFLHRREAKRGRTHFPVLLPAGASIPSASDGLPAFGCGGNPRLLARRCRLGLFYGLYPGGGCSVEVVLPMWNKVLLVPIHLAFFCSGNGDGRVRWGSSYVEALFRSLPAAHRPGWKVRLLAFWFEDKEAASGCVEVWRVDLVRISCGSVCCRYGARGVSPADVVPTASSRPKRVSTAATSKSSWRLGSFRPRIRGGGPPVMAGGSGVGWIRPAECPGTCL